MKTYEGDVKITVENSAEWEKKLKEVTKVTGSVHVYGSAKADVPSVGGGWRFRPCVRLGHLQYAEQI